MKIHYFLENIDMNLTFSPSIGNRLPKKLYVS